MLSEVLAKKGYKLFRGEVFIDREEEIEFFKNYFNELPRRILFVYGPKSTGKTTLIEYVIENELIEDKKLFKSNRFNIKYVNFRGKMIFDYDTFLDAIIEEKEEFEKEEEFNRNYNLLKVFALEAKTIKKYKQKKRNLFDILEDEFKKSKKKNVFIIDEIQTLEDIYINGNKELLKEFLNFCVRLTKELHLSHVVILTSNTIFLNRIYNDSKLKKTSKFKLISHPDEVVAKKLLVDLGYNETQIDLILDYYGTVFIDLLSLYQFIKPEEGIEKLREFLEREKLDAFNQIDEILIKREKYKLPENRVELFIKVAKEIIENGKYELRGKRIEEKEEVYPIIEVFCQKEILFFDPQTGVVSPNSRIYLKAMEEFVK